MLHEPGLGITVIDPDMTFTSSPSCIGCTRFELTTFQSRVEFATHLTGLSPDKSLVWFQSLGSSINEVTFLVRREIDHTTTNQKQENNCDVIFRGTWFHNKCKIHSINISINFAFLELLMNYLAPITYEDFFKLKNK